MATFHLSPRIVRRIRFLLITVMVIVVLVVGQYFLWRTVRLLTVRLRDKQSQVQQVESLQTRIETTRSDYKKQQASLEQLKAVVPLGQDTIQILERLEGVASQMGIEADVVDIREGEPLWSSGDGATVFPLVVAVSTAGSPAQLLGYVEKMEHVQELMQVQTFTIKVGGAGSFNLDIEMTFYLQQQDNNES